LFNKQVISLKKKYQQRRCRPHAEKRGGFVWRDTKKEFKNAHQKGGWRRFSLSLGNTSSRISMNIEREVSRERRSAFLNAF
jgi:hypothetical protein